MDLKHRSLINGIVIDLWYRVVALNCFSFLKHFSHTDLALFSCVVFFLGEGFDYLDAPVYRVTGADVPMPYAQTLEQFALPQKHNIVNTVKKSLNI